LALAGLSTEAAVALADDTKPDGGPNDGGTFYKTRFFNDGYTSYTSDGAWHNNTITALNRSGLAESTWTLMTRSPAFCASWSISSLLRPVQKCHPVGVVAFRSGSSTAANTLATPISVLSRSGAVAATLAIAVTSIHTDNALDKKIRN